MIIASIDLRQGRAVQLRQGKEQVLSSERDPIDLAREFNRYGPVAVVDLDAAMGTGDNLALIEQLCRIAEVRVGGGIRDEARGRDLLRCGARQLVIGTAASPELLSAFSPDQVIAALDQREGIVLDEGWTRSTGEPVLERAARLAPYCSGYLCTFVEHEGGMGGLPAEQALKLAEQLPHPVTVAGGVASTREAVELARLGMDVQVGMALYTGELDLAEAFTSSLDFEKVGLVPTVVQDGSGQVLMLAYSSPESLRRALREGKGIYYSRSRDEIWEKGASSGHVQRLVAARTDCDRDALLFAVEQTGVACHLGRYSCFGHRRFSVSQLFDVLEARLRSAPAGSYTARLYADREYLLRQFMEEAFEITRSADRDNLQWEAADLLYHMAALLVQEGLGWSDVVNELRSRHRMRREGGEA
ncbi:MAG: bifunctional phosphoribosyl-AMP cyclohydrolase/phosphoribosyl-ATP diphosphatase HisIE [Deltaproteobacteria bacterium]|nr:bifunctional phosphoribosyl-AMP cyclohydrolase/phosphoribosyl-ATP diphosphatase HisIE [Deltaproteobacteria bacterium]